MKKLLSLLLACVMGLTLLAGCSNTDPSSSSNGQTDKNASQTIAIAQSANFSMGFAPAVQSYEATYYMNNFYEPLVKYQDGEYQPCLATDWTNSDDGLTYTFHLREDVKFNDGTPFNAEAVKLYFDNMKSVIGTSSNYGQLDMLTSEITVDDEYTISFHLTRPYYNVLNDLSMVMPRGILSASAFNEDGSLNSEYLMNHTPGTGPYMFEGVNDTATEYTFVRNPNYWGEDPDVDSFTVKVIPESKVAAMRAGEVDFIIGSDTLDADSYQELSSTEGITGVISDFDFVTEFIALNDEVVPLNDINIRNAIQMAIDKESIAQNIYSGLRTEANSVMPADMPYCKADVTTPSYDMDAAIELMDKSGWTDTDGDGIREKDGKKLSFTITYPSTGVYDKVVLFFQDSMKKLGIEITTNPIDLMAFMQQVFTEGNYEITAYMSYWFPYDPYTFVANMYPSTDYTDASGIYSTDPQIAKALATMSEEEAKELIAGLYKTDDLDTVQNIFTTALNSANESSVVIPLNYRNEYAVFNNEVIESYTFNSIPNHVDVAAIKLK
ncbi:ABC transporter substrate-binding protein [Hydrogeniiclostridium mannosilyticum]|uniref:ABC transporter substrate-binding protein n=1 Tax=Hydrogeniiclostridium mannosilyticum TaxID=2764322 RepID=UPI0018AB8391|nr:ABC transporter substrate-binding protein [Hydrogeniiclostridium mannosilyticum]